MEFIFLGMGLLSMFSVPFFYSKMYPSKLYEKCKVVDLEFAINPFHCDMMTIEKEGQKWNLPISRDVFNQISVGNTIDFYYNGEDSVKVVELSVFKK